MGRIRSVARLTKELEFATARQTYYSTPRPGKTTVDKNPKDTVFYTCSTYKIGTTGAILSIQAAAAAIAKFGMTELGLLATAAGAARPPRGFRPAKVHSMIGSTAPTVGVSPVSGRRVIKYSAVSTGDAKANFTAPIGGATDDVQRGLFAALVTANETEFNAGPGGYGRFYFTPEYLPTSG